MSYSRFRSMLDDPRKRLSKQAPLLALPIGSIDQLALEEDLREIGKSDPDVRPIPKQTAP
jgi:hypothetical protein